MDRDFEKGSRQSPLAKIYDLLGARTPLELSNLYSDKDEELWRSGAWDDENPELITNRVKDGLEMIDPSTLNNEEKNWRDEILWFWYHHATSYVFQKGNKEKAKKYVEQALRYQSADHPNQITKFLSYVVEGDEQGARSWADQITEEPERTTAQNLLKKYFKN